MVVKVEGELGGSKVVARSKIRGLSLKVWARARRRPVLLTATHRPWSWVLIRPHCCCGAF